MGVEEARLFCIHKRDPNVLMRYPPDGGEPQPYPTDCGLAGHSFRKRKVKIVRNAYNHHRYNGIIDIETSMPLLCVPILCDSGGDQALGVFQMTYSKGVIGVANGKKPIVSPHDLETLEFFGQQLAQTIINNFELEDLFTGAMTPTSSLYTTIKRKKPETEPETPMRIQVLHDS
jgi:GAF domain-containing protein